MKTQTICIILTILIIMIFSYAFMNKGKLCNKKENYGDKPGQCSSNFDCNVNAGFYCDRIPKIEKKGHCVKK